MIKKNIVTYGEILLRLTPLNHGDLINQSSALNMSFAGAEGNIVSSLSNLGHNTTIITSLPNNSLGKSAFRFLNSFGVNTDYITFKDGRIGSYYIEHGASLRGGNVIYDRLDSCFSSENIAESIWLKVFKDSNFYVLTGITPALSKECQKNILNSIKIAKLNNVKIVFDLNYRRNLWTGKESLTFITKIINDVDILIGNIGSISDIFGFKYNSTSEFKELESISMSACDFISNKYSFDLVGMTIRNQINATHNQLGGIIKIKDKFHSGRFYDLEIIDRLGGGDAFVSGLLHGLIKNYRPDQMINFANACFALTQTIKGDVNYFEEEEIIDFSSINYTGHIKR